MKVNYKSKNGRLACEFEGQGHLDVWKQIASFQEVFEEEKCGKCGSDNLQCKVRIAKDPKKKEKEYQYPELLCKKCGAKLSYGIMDDDKGTLFPIRFERSEGEYIKDADGKAIPVGNYGWKKYNKETGKEE